MEHLPNYISISFILTTLISLAFLYKAVHYSKPVILVTLLWLTFQAVLGLSGFYTITTGVPPRFALLLVPPIIFITFLFLFRKCRMVFTAPDIQTLTLIHIVRIPVELVLYTLFIHKVVPEVMTFNGRNLDILSGITAPIVYYFGYIKKVWGRKILIAWNIICLLLLANIVVTAVFSAPFAFQRLSFGQSNIALFYFPFVWLPGFVVPVALFAHLAVIRDLLRKVQQ